MKASPDFYEGDVMLRQLPLERMMEVLFYESGLEKPDGNQPGFTLSIGKETRWFTRNLAQCFILELHLLLKQRQQGISGIDHVVVVNGKPKLRLPVAGATGAAANCGGAASMLVDGVGVGCPDATCQGDSAPSAKGGVASKNDGAAEEGGQAS